MLSLICGVFCCFLSFEGKIMEEMDLDVQHRIYNDPKLRPFLDDKRTNAFVDGSRGAFKPRRESSPARLGGSARDKVEIR